MASADHIWLVKAVCQWLEISLSDTILGGMVLETTAVSRAAISEGGWSAPRRRKRAAISGSAPDLAAMRARLLRQIMIMMIIMLRPHTFQLEVG